MKRKPQGLIHRQAGIRIARIQDQIRAADYICSGSLIRRTKLCGKPSCRCAHDLAARHGPYYEWGFMKDGRLVHRMVTAEQAAILKRAIANYRRILRLLRHWEGQTLQIFIPKSRRKK
jgi:hypothetical protein